MYTIMGRYFEDARKNRKACGEILRDSGDLTTLEARLQTQVSVSAVERLPAAMEGVETSRAPWPRSPGGGPFVRMQGALEGTPGLYGRRLKKRVAAVQLASSSPAARNARRSSELSSTQNRLSAKRA